MSSIQKIYIAGYKYDVMYTKCCVASVRKWYPEIPVILIKDESYGTYSTQDIQKYFNTNVLNCNIKNFGWGFSKLEALFVEKKEKFLILDSDTVMMGPVLDKLNGYSEEFIVPAVKTTIKFQSAQYFNPDDIIKWDVDYKHTGYGFNTGQWVGTSGIFKRKDLRKFINYDLEPIRLFNDELFKLGEQGLLNYFLFKNQQSKRITLNINPFMETGDNPKVSAIKSIDSITKRESMIIHWAGIRTSNIEDAANGWILKYFIDLFYVRIPLKKLKYLIDNQFKIFIGNIKLKLKNFLNF